MNTRVFFLCVPLLAMSLLGFPKLQAGAEEPCVQQLKDLGRSCLRYAKKNDGRMPGSLSELYYRAYVNDFESFICPVNSTEILHRTEIDKKSSFVLSPEAPGDGVIPVVQERSADNHAGKGIYVFYSDGSVRWQTTTPGTSDGDGHQREAKTLQAPDQTAPLSEERTNLEAERRRLAREKADLEAQRKRLEEEMERLKQVEREQLVSLQPQKPLDVPKIVYDSQTGLEWFAGPDQDTTWQEAQDWAERLNFAGGGWRMPKRKELKSLFRKGVGTRNMDPAFKVTGWYVWSADKKGFTLFCRGWGFNFYSGRVLWRSCNRSADSRVFAVRQRQ